MPSLELMEAAGRAVADAAARACAGGAGAGRLRQGQQRRRRPGRRPPSAPRRGFEVEVAAALARRRAQRRTPPRTWSGSTRLARRRAGRPRRRGWTGSAAIVDAIFGTGFSGAPRAPAAAAIDGDRSAAAAGSAIVACDIASGVDASDGEVEGAAVEADVTVSFHAAKVGHRIAPGEGAPASCGWSPIGIPDGAPGEPAAGVIEAAVLELLPRRGSGSTKFSSGQVIDRRRLARADRRRADVLAGGDPRRRRLRDASPCPADLEPIFEAKLPEVMSVGRRRGDGCLAPAAAEAILGRAESAAPACSGPGSGRDRGSLELVREARRADRAAAGDRRRRPQRASPDRPRDRLAARGRPTDPHPARR